MKKLLLLFLALMGIACGQSTQSSMYVNVWTNKTGNQTYLTIPNIGATSHEFYLVSNDNGGTCGLTANLFGSSNSAFTDLVVLKTVSIGGGTNTTVLQGNGLYPYIGVSITSVTNCSTTGYYYGSKAVIDPFTVGGQNSTGYKAPLLQDWWGGLIVNPILGNNYTFISSNVSGATFRSAVSHVGVLATIFVGLAGVSSSLTIKEAGNTVLTLDTTKVGSYNLGYQLQPGAAYTYTTVGTSTANITLVGQFQ